MLRLLLLLLGVAGCAANGGEPLQASPIRLARAARGITLRGPLALNDPSSLCTRKIAVISE